MNKTRRTEPVNIDDMTDKQLISYLNKVIDDEIDKPLGKQNLDLVHECVDFIMEIDNKEIRLTEDDIRRETQNILQKYNNRKIKSLNSKHLKSVFIAACIVLALFVMNTIALAFGYDALSLIKQWGKDLLNISEGIAVEKDGITFIRSDVEHKYKSVSDLFKGEKIDILFPDYLPEGVVLKQIDCISVNSNNRYIFTFNTGELSFDISGEYSDNIIKTLESSNEILENNNITYYITSMDDGSRQSMFICKNKLYTVRYNDYSELLKIIKSINQ